MSMPVLLTDESTGSESFIWKRINFWLSVMEQMENYPIGDDMRALIQEVGE
jgi:hypothetical protein